MTGRGGNRSLWPSFSRTTAPGARLRTRFDWFRAASGAAEGRGSERFRRGNTGAEASGDAGCLGPVSGFQSERCANRTAHSGRNSHEFRHPVRGSERALIGSEPRAERTAGPRERAVTAGQNLRESRRSPRLRGRGDPVAGLNRNSPQLPRPPEPARTPPTPPTAPPAAPPPRVPTLPAPGAGAEGAVALTGALGV